MNFEKCAIMPGFCKSGHKCPYYLVPPRSLSRKQIKTKSTLCKLPFIVHGRVRGLFKVILQYKNEAPQLQKWALYIHNKFFKFQGSVQRNVLLL